jgi:hypothetical protein
LVPREFEAFSTVPHVGAIHENPAITSPGYGDFSAPFVNIAGEFKIGTTYLANPDESRELPFYYMIEQ